MSRWIVSHVPSWSLLTGLVIVVAGGAVFIQWYVRRRFPALTGDGHNDATRFTYGFIGFVVSSMWGQINTADANARAEGAEASQLARDLNAFEKADGTRIRTSLLDYERAAIAEWNQEGRAPEADAALARLYTAYQQVNPATDTQKTFLATSYSNLDKTSQARTVRLLTARENTGPSWPLWSVIFLTSAMVMGTVIVYGVEKPAIHYPMVAIVGLIVAANLFLILELAHPYAGEISTSSDPLQQVVAILR